MEKIIAEGNYMEVSHYATNGLSEVYIKFTDTGEDECKCVLEDGVMYAYKNDELVVCSNLFRVTYKDTTE